MGLAQGSSQPEPTDASLKGYILRQRAELQVSFRVCREPHRSRQIVVDPPVGSEADGGRRLGLPIAQATGEVFAGDERLELLHERWIAVIGDHVRGEG